MFLSFFGLASIGLSCLVALFLYHVVFGVQYLGILNGVAAFVIVGIGKSFLASFLCSAPAAPHPKALPYPRQPAEWSALASLRGRRRRLDSELRLWWARSTAGVSLSSLTDFNRAVTPCAH